MLREMQRLQFNDETEFDTSGKLRVEEKNGKMYVVGEGVMIMVDDKAKGDEVIERLKQEKLAMNKQGQEQELRKWIETKGKIDELKRQIKKLEAEGVALEAEAIPQLRELENQEFRIDSILVELKSKVIVSMKYKPLYEKTLSMINAKVRRIIESMAQKAPFRTEKPKEYLKLKEAPPIRKGSLYQTNYLEHSNGAIRALAYLATDNVKRLRQTAMLDDSALVRKAAFIRLSQLQPELIKSSRETEFSKYAQQEPIWKYLAELEVLVDIFEELAEEEV